MIKGPFVINFCENHKDFQTKYNFPFQNKLKGQNKRSTVAGVNENIMSPGLTVIKGVSVDLKLNKIRSKH